MHDLSKASYYVALDLYDDGLVILSNVLSFVNAVLMKHTTIAT